MEKVIAEIDLTKNEIDVDWIRAARLLKDGSKEAKAELKKMAKNADSKTA